MDRFNIKAMKKYTHQTIIEFLEGSLNEQITLELKSKILLKKKFAQEVAMVQIYSLLEATLTLEQSQPFNILSPTAQQELNSLVRKYNLPLQKKSVSKELNTTKVLLVS